MGTRIKSLRGERGQGETAAAIGIKQPSLSAIESGKTKKLAGETVAMLCKVFHTTAEYVCFGEGAPGGEESAADEAELIRIIRSLPVDKRASVIDAARGILSGISRASSPSRSSTTSPVKPEASTTEEAEWSTRIKKKLPKPAGRRRGQDREAG